MPATIISLHSGDGGIGKTTLTAALGARAAAAGLKALVIDCNAGCRRLDMLLGHESRIIFDAADAASSVCTPERAVIHDCNHTLPDLLAAPFDAESSPDEAQWSTMMESYKAQYDWIALDAPTGVNAWSSLAAKMSDRAYVAVSPDDGSMRCSQRVLDKLREDGHDRLLIVNRIKLAFMNEGLHYQPDVVAQTLDTPVAGVFPEDEWLRMAAARRLLHELDVRLPITRKLDALIQRTMGAPLPKGWTLAKRPIINTLIKTITNNQSAAKEVWA